jgi:hypothetical protein
MMSRRAICVLAVGVGADGCDRRSVSVAGGIPAWTRRSDPELHGANTTVRWPSSASLIQRAEAMRLTATRCTRRQYHDRTGPVPIGARQPGGHPGNRQCSERQVNRRILGRQRQDLRCVATGARRWQANRAHVVVRRGLRQRPFRTRSHRLHEPVHARTKPLIQSPVTPPTRAVGASKMNMSAGEHLTTSISSSRRQGGAGDNPAGAYKVLRYCRKNI